MARNLFFPFLFFFDCSILSQPPKSVEQKRPLQAVVSRALLSLAKHDLLAPAMALEHARSLSVSSTSPDSSFFTALVSSLHTPSHIKSPQQVLAAPEVTTALTEGMKRAGGSPCPVPSFPPAARPGKWESCQAAALKPNRVSWSIQLCTRWEARACAWWKRALSFAAENRAASVRGTGLVLFLLLHGRGLLGATGCQHRQPPFGTGSRQHLGVTLKCTYKEPTDTATWFCPGSLNGACPSPQLPGDKRSGVGKKQQIHIVLEQLILLRGEANLNYSFRLRVLSFQALCSCFHPPAPYKGRAMVPCLAHMTALSTAEPFIPWGILWHKRLP